MSPIIWTSTSLAFYLSNDYNKTHLKEEIFQMSSYAYFQKQFVPFPEAKLGIGPAIENGFYYDFDIPQQLTPEDLPKIEARSAN